MEIIMKNRLLTNSIYRDIVTGPPWWEKIGKGARWSKLSILNISDLFGGKRWGKDAEQPKLGVLIHFGPFWWEIMGKKVQNDQNWAFQICYSVMLNNTNVI